MAVFDDEDAIQYDDMLPDRAGSSSTNGGSQAFPQQPASGGDAGATADQLAIEAVAQAEAELQAATTAALRPQKRRRQPFGHAHLASTRGLAMLHEMAFQALRSKRSVITVSSRKGREVRCCRSLRVKLRNGQPSASLNCKCHLSRVCLVSPPVASNPQASGMASMCELWREWAASSYPGMSLTDMIPKLATMSGKGEVKGTAARIREQDKVYISAERKAVDQGMEPGLKSAQMVLNQEMLAGDDEEEEEEGEEDGNGRLGPGMFSPSPARAESSAAGLPTPPTAKSRTPTGSGYARPHYKPSASARKAAARMVAAVEHSADTASRPAAAAQAQVPPQFEEDYGDLGVDLDDYME
jgi:hypothetical protein